MKKSGNAKIDLVNGDVRHTLIVFSMPFVFSTLLQTLYSMVDMIVVGNIVGKEGLSALSVGGQVLEMITAVCVGFSSAGQILIAQCVGAGKQEELRKLNSTLTVLMAVFAVLAMAIGVVGCDRFLALLNTPQESFQYAHDYMLICFLGVIFIAFYNMISAIFRGMGDSVHPLLFVGIATIVNVVFDLIFIAGLGWAAAGAAIATVMGQAVSVVCSLVLLAKRKEEYHFTLKPGEFGFSWKYAAMILKLAVPMAIQSAAVQISFLFVNGMFNAQGVAVSAAFGATGKIRHLPNILSQAVSLGAAAMYAQNFGAGKTSRVKEIYKNCCFLTCLFMAVFGIAFLLFPTWWFSLFTSDADVMAYARMCMFCIVLELPAKIFMPGGGGLINGCGNVRLSFVLAFCDAFLGRIFLAWLLGSFLGWGVFGYMLGYTMATYVTSIPQTVYYLSGLWKKRAKLV